jgi:hypothetical protein
MPRLDRSSRRSLWGDRAARIQTLRAQYIQSSLPRCPTSSICTKSHRPVPTTSRSGVLLRSAHEARPYGCPGATSRTARTTNAVRSKAGANRRWATAHFRKSVMRKDGRAPREQHRPFAIASSSRVHVGAHGLLPCSFRHDLHIVRVRGDMAIALSWPPAQEPAAGGTRSLCAEHVRRGVVYFDVGLRVGHC